VSAGVHVRVGHTPAPRELQQREGRQALRVERRGGHSARAVQRTCAATPHCAPLMGYLSPMQHTARTKPDPFTPGSSGTSNHTRPHSPPPHKRRLSGTAPHAPPEEAIPGAHLASQSYTTPLSRASSASCLKHIAPRAYSLTYP